MLRESSILTARLVFLLAIQIASSSTGAEKSKTSRPDVLMIVIDDMNDWISLLDSSSPIKTPNMERLAKRGVLFQHAYCVSAACNPSRVATLTGRRPTSSGVYGNRANWRRALPEARTIMQRFRDAGYSVRGAGKIFHHHLNGAFHDEESFDEFRPMREQLYPNQKLNDAPKYGSRNTDWGEWPEQIEESIDYGTRQYVVEAIRSHRDTRPLFLACGLFKPHSPFFAPRQFHERYRSIELPVRNENDWDDLPSGAAALMKSKKWFWDGMSKLEKRVPDSYLDFIRSYAACVSFTDAQIGQVLDAVDANVRFQNAIIVLWSDHGFHLGEKNHIEKFGMWEKTNHIPFIVVAPGVTAPGTVCEQPVDLSVLYPTLLELAGLEPCDECDGTSIVPLLRDPDREWKQPALMTYQRGNHSVRSQRWRFIRYADGTEELYDHSIDPQEWVNLAERPEWEPVLNEHRAWLPESNAEPVGDLTVKKSRR